MGSMSQTEATPDVPGALKPIFNQASNDISGLNIPQLQTTQQDRSAGQFSADMFNQGGIIDNASNLLNQTFRGDFLTPDSNPFLQNIIQSMQRAFTENFQLGSDQLNSQFGLAGQPTSSGTLGTNTRLLGERGLQGLNEQIGNLLFSNFQNERGLQQNAFNFAGVPGDLAFQSTQLGAIPRNLQVQQFGLDQVPINLRTALLGNTPIATPVIGPSPFAQNLSGVGQALGGVGSIVGAFKGAPATGGN